jgi:hypothetical protein
MDNGSEQQLLKKSLEQGSHFKKYQHHYNNLVGIKRLNLIEQTTGQHLGNVEPLTNIQGFGQESPEMKQLTAMETNFNNKLQTYSAIYKQYLTNIASAKDNATLHSNINVKDSNGKFYYVNEYGVARGYSQDAWAHRDATCPSTIPNDNTVAIFNTLKVGNDKKPNEPCNLDGKTIIAQTTNNKAWITPEGRKKWFPNENIWEIGMKNGCNPNPVHVTDGVFDMFDATSDMTPSANCNAGLGFVNMKNELEKLNNELVQIANQINNKVGEMVQKNKVVDDAGEKTKLELQERLQKLQTQRALFEELQTEEETLQAEYDNNKMMIHSSYYHYMVWTIAALTLGAVAVHHVTK